MPSELTAYHKVIIELIKTNSRVLDLGCGSGRLLKTLQKQKNVSGYGIEIDPKAIVSCVKNGLSVYHGDINEGLPGFSDHSFDVVILSQTLQQVQDPKYLLEEMLRVGKKAIITFPNFGYWRVRLQLLLGGCAPVTKNLPYDWYNSPNIRAISIQDFRNLCERSKLKIEKEISLDGFAGNAWSNLLSQQGLFIVSR